MLRLVAVVRTDVSEERIASIIMGTRMGEVGTTLAFFIVTAVKTSNITIKEVCRNCQILSVKTSTSMFLHKGHVLKSVLGSEEHFSYFGPDYPKFLLTGLATVSCTYFIQHLLILPSQIQILFSTMLIISSLKYSLYSLFSIEGCRG
jgi:hypothetical protein